VPDLASEGLVEFDDVDDAAAVDRVDSAVVVEEDGEIVRPCSMVLCCQGPRGSWRGTPGGRND